MNYRRVMRIPAPEAVAAAPAEIVSVLAGWPADRRSTSAGLDEAR